jgi:hypothetical protein
MEIKKRLLFSLVAALLFIEARPVLAQQMQRETYCNPLNLDYTYMVHNHEKNISYRSGADPAIVSFRGEYYLFVTRSLGYWHSTDLQNWDFITPEKWYFQGCNAPAAHNYKDSVLYVAGDPSGTMSVLYTDNPKKGDWKATPSVLTDLQDPDLFIDDDGRTYLYWGSSNKFPIRGRELDRNNRFNEKTGVTELFNLDGDKHGWERFGESHTDSIHRGFIEGAWLTKHNGKYYMQYAAPGTEFNVYADGVYVSDHAMGPYTYQAHNPICYKPGGFMNGSGHGSTVLGPGGRYWHFATMSLSINYKFERRLCMFPLFFDKDGIMYTDTRFGDYPHYAASMPEKAGLFRGWMLLSYKKPVKVSSHAESYVAANLTDEDNKTFWVAAENNDKQWVQIDLQKPALVRALQINYHDYHSNLFGRQPGLFHRYRVEGSTDGKSWFTLIDKSQSFKDAPNDYQEVAKPEMVRYVRYENIHVPMTNLAISDIRIFGTGTGHAPKKITNVKYVRQHDKRNVAINWEKQADAQGYNILWGIAPDKLYNSWMVYGDNHLMLRSLDNYKKYYFTIESFNENGVSPRSNVALIP